MSTEARYESHTIRERRRFESIISSWTIPKHTPIRAHNSLCGSPLTPFGSESGPFRKTHGPASSQVLPVQPVARSKQGLGLVPFLQTLLPAMVMVQYLSPNEDRLHGQL
jgi:hypothetical protein